MKKYVVNALCLLLASLISPASGALVPIFSDDFESGTLANWTTTIANPLDPFTPSNAVPANGRWSALMNTSIDRMHHNVIGDNGGVEATGHLLFSFWIYDDGTAGGTVGPTRVFNELRGYSGGTGLPNGGTAASGALAQLLAAGKFNSVTLPGEVFTSTKYQGRVAFHTPQPVGDTGWFNLNDPGSPNRSIGWHRFDIEAMPDGTTFKFFVDGILCRTFTGGTAATYDTIILGPGLGSQVGNAWIDGMALARIDDPPTITCPSNQTAVATSVAGAVVNYPPPTATDDGGAPTVVCNPPSGSTLPIGTTGVDCVATDSANQTARCQFDVIVTSRPVDITCPPNIVVKGNGPTPVNYPAPTVAGDCPPITVNCNPPSGSNFPIGNTVVHCIATDGCGNRDECRFIVTVRPVRPPYVIFPTDHLPPPQGMYVSQDDVRYENGLVLTSLRLRNPGVSYPPPRPGETGLHEFDAEVNFEYAMGPGTSPSPATAPAHVLVRIVHTDDEGGVQTFDTEILALEISGGGLPPGVMIRESPTRASTGKLQMQPGGPDFLISSFFDVFTELTLDGGMNWSPSEEASPVDLAFDPTHIPPINPPNTDLPPRNDIYVTMPFMPQSYGEGIMIRNVRHRYPSRSLPAPQPGETQIHDFNALMDFELSLDGGHSWQSKRAEAKTVVLIVHIGRLLDSDDRPATHLYETEMLQLEISGGDLPPGVRLRESPTRQSQGGTALRSWPDGTHQLHSFFDIFTELTVDGGFNWMQSPDPARVELQSYALDSENPTDEMPPPAGCYKLSALDPHISYAGGAMMLKDVVNQGFSKSLPPPAPGQSQIYEFDSILAFMMSRDGGETWMPGTGTVHQVVRMDGLSGQVGDIRHFDMEMLQLEISGGSLPQGVRLRESPTKQSLGRTSIRSPLDPSGGVHVIDSFFDIFTELTFDDGQTWPPSDTGPANMVLWPNATDGTLVCADGRPLPNCQVTVEFYNQNGLAAQGTTTTDANGYWWLCIHAAGPHQNAYFIISSPCCGHTWTIPTTKPWGSLGTLVCDRCGPRDGCTNAPPGMVNWWTFDETSGVIVNDIEDFNNAGARQNGASSMPGKVKNAVCFKADVQYVRVPNHPEVNFLGSCADPNPPESFTIDAWIKADSVQGLSTILDKRENPQSPRGYSLFIDNGRLGFQMADGQGNGNCNNVGAACNNYIEANPSITPGVWHHVAVSVIRCDINGLNVGRLFVNGVQRLVFANPRQGILDNLSDLIIGMRNPAFGYNFFRGCVDELEYFKRALSQDEIRTIYNAGAGGKCKPCIQIECPPEVRKWTCNRSANVCFNVPATGSCGDVTVVCTPPSCSAFQVGTTPVNCEATDTAGNKTNCTFNVVVVQDTLPPVIHCPTNRIEKWMCEFNAGVVVTWPISATDDCDQKLDIICVPPSGSVFPPGITTVTCTARDDCGQTAQCQFQVNVTVDTTPPVLACPTEIREWTCELNGIRVSYVIGVTDDCDRGPTVICSPPSGAFFPIGTTTVTCVARDRCGNQSLCEFPVTVVRDTSPPSLACPTGFAYDDCRERAVTWVVGVVDDYDPSPTVICTPPAGSVFPIGTTTVTCVATDRCGNSSSCSFNVSITCPCVTPPPGLVDWWTFDEPAGGGIANDIMGINNLGVHVNGPPVIAGKVKNALCFNGDNQYVQVRDHPEVNFLGDCSNDVGESFTIDAWIRQEPNAQQGVRTFVDKRNNPASPQGYSFYVVDGRLGFQLGNGVGNNLCNSAGSACFNYVEPNASITPGVWHFVAVTVERCRGMGTLYVDGSPVLTFTPLGGDYNNPADLYVGIRSPAFGPANFRGCIDELEIFKRALTQAELQSIYNAGSSGKCKPCIVCPDDITVETCEQGTNVCYQVPTVSEDCPGLTVQCDPPPCSFFPVNTSTLVTCVARDALGRAVETCEFAVTVLGDTRPPTIVCPQDVSVPNDPDRCGAVVEYPLPQATDNCPGVTITCSPPAGSFFPVAATLVTCIATDASGNTNTCTFSVIVRDVQPPRIVCPDDIRRESCSEVVIDYTVTATDNCPGVTVVCVPPSGSSFPVGTTTVTCTATDQGGNSVSCSFKVEIICPCVPPPAGMVDWWTFDEPAGPIARDIAGFNNQGVHVNGPSVIAGKVNNALCFNGDNQYVQVRDHPEVNFLGSCAAGAAPAESFTIDAWIRADDVQGVRTILDKRVNPSDPIGYSLFIFNGRLAFQMADGSGGGGVCGPGASCQNYGEPTPSIVAGQWHFVAVSVQRCDPNGGPGVGRLYVDGNVVLTFTPRSGNMNNPSDLYIGIRAPAFGPANFRGCIDELEYFKRALTQAELQAIYNAGSHGKCKPCLRCPDDIRVQTCARGTNVCYQLPVSENCHGLTVRCIPPPCSFFPANTSTLVVCEAFNAAGVPVERCTFSVTVTTPRPRLEIVYLPDGRVRICWESDCPGWRLQCTRSLNSPILWQFVNAPVTVVSNRYCVTLPAKGLHQFYRLCRRDVKEVDAADDLFPPLGTYRSPDDLATAFNMGDPDRPLLMRKFAHPIPPNVPRRPPPCPTCPPDTHQWQTQISFQFSMDGGQTWQAASALADVSVEVRQGIGTTPDVSEFDAELLHLEAVSGIDPRFMIRESPTLRSTGQTTIRAEVGTIRIGSFFDVFTEISMDGGQTWIPSETDTPMDLMP